MWLDSGPITQYFTLPRDDAAGPERAVRLRSLLISQPITQFKRDRRFYLKYDSFWALACIAASVAMFTTHHTSVFGPWQWKQLWAFPALLFLSIQCHVFVHNATHGNLPKLVNRLIGELAGLFIVVRYASWDIVHMRHHRYSDDMVKDPHPAYPSYLLSFWRSVVTVEQQLMQEYFDTWGDTPENRAKEAFRAKISYGANIFLLVAWYLLLGPGLFFLCFVPANILGAMFIGHFNWSTHNGEVGKEFRPVNLNHGYYWFGNRIFFGIYFHANHHKRPSIFNPMLWKPEYGKPEPVVDGPQPEPALAPANANAKAKPSDEDENDRAVA